MLGTPLSQVAQFSVSEAAAMAAKKSYINGEQIML